MYSGLLYIQILYHWLTSISFSNKCYSCVNDCRLFDTLVTVVDNI